MRRTALLLAALAFVGSTLTINQLAAQDKEQEAAMEAYVLAATPGPVHAVLASLAGKYTATVKSWENPGGEPVVTTGTVERKMILDGRYLQEEYRGEMMGQAFKGVGITGFDNTEKKVVSSWIDSMGTGILLMKGSIDDAKNVITLKGEYNDPATGELTKLKGVTRIVSPNEQVYDMYSIDKAGKEVKTLEITYKKQM